ncbi:MAG TPA: [Fe-Fe] hydrogenase large subunit C-terminal domain-containing protein [Phycisphaerae bacterium]|nr:[Fe-Fe] hydrogenase large subunit C-terminal domain-containing protein [Phycisphaerae bacterium]HON66999.1 [Fe-Fe] hydrogenase large subunit C-terminal domain-containing protein [Phycisphaerae bacterium]HOQ84950.1 [Fe-Fe] hydrogenase large subunit C-terminal domain-containing protein [Phycisphaerae bacterium]HPU25283.1 [Fe-Fe] hydrogenase large subunit C-terminal domain-containing protein [Phycisphaerae bacterium]HQE26635.1 [Fe-Fe] hydrogenase large subunit C-terminal domain-containing prote
MSSTCFVETIKERCRVCYTCVRECPAKAIRIADGQAEVIPERCIACGNCVRVCSQSAKQAASSVEQVLTLLSGDQPVAAILAPSFPAEFGDTDYRTLVGMLRAAGFDLVCEVAFGADLVARQYERILATCNGRRFISTTCPAIVHYVERYHPGLVDSLAPVVSPMVATARVLHAIHGPELRIVFIGPCIAKKAEAISPHLAGDVDAALTYLELRQMFGLRDIFPAGTPPSEFDPPHSGTGGLFPISRGMLQAANISEDLMTGEVVATEGRSHVLEAIKEFESGDLGARLLEALCCHGCIMGVGINADTPLFHRRRRVREYVCGRMAALDRDQWRSDIERFASLDLRRTFAPNDQRMPAPQHDELTEIMIRMGKLRPEDELNCGACGYETCREHAFAIFKGLAEHEMCLPYTIDQLRKTIAQLANTQEALMQSEKLASMGQLAAGIAHEVNNPLGVVLMYAHLLLKECDEHSRIREALQTIVEQSDRCKKIVAGLLNFARQTKVVRYPVEMPDLVRRALATLTVPLGISVRIEQLTDDVTAELDRDQIIQVLTNLISNAIAAMPTGGVLTIRIEGDAHSIKLSVCDTGAGIPEQNLSKIFEPFFTTKPMGKGTGLGLAVTYGIVKMHSGDIRVQSNADPRVGPTGTTFTVMLPRTGVP